MFDQFGLEARMKLTASKETSLCRRCRNAQYMRGRGYTQEALFCHNMNKFLPWEPEQCSTFDDATVPSLYDMKDIAWQLATKSGKVVGFVNPSTYQQLKKEGKVDEPAVDNNKGGNNAQD